MSTFFHGAPLMLAPGSIIEPGNWGRIIRTYLPNEPITFGVAFREATLERERISVAPQRPSRLDCVFACPTEAELRSFIHGSGRFRDVLYEVEPVGTAPLHYGDHNLPTLPPDAPYFDAFATRARLYWTAPSPSQNVEVLIGGPVRVLRKLP